MRIVKEHVKKNKIFARFFHIHFMPRHEFVGEIRSFYFVLSHYISLTMWVWSMGYFSFVQFICNFYLRLQAFTEFIVKWWWELIRIGMRLERKMH